jgi:predicted nucleic acid-binding protein
MIMIDSNIWAYFFDADTPEHKSVVADVRKALKDGAMVNAVVAMEVAHYLIKNLGPILGREKLDIFLSFPIRLDELNSDLIKGSIDELCTYPHLGIGGRDATLLASMRKNQVERILTHDKAFKRVPDVKVMDPIKK